MTNMGLESLFGGSSDLIYGALAMGLSLMALFAPLWASARGPVVTHPHLEDDLHCQRQHIVKLLTPEEAEREEWVFDPLGRAPNAPFGHLAQGWRSFLELNQPGFQLWSFKVPGRFPSFKAKSDHTREWSVAQGEKMGYVWVHKGKIKAEFLTQWD